VSYGKLTESEQAHWDEYTNLRAISDWPGFDGEQDQRRADSRQWIVDRREYIEALAEGEVEGEEAGWDINSRQERYDFLGGMNSGSPKHEVTLPCTGMATDAEKVYIEEREVYLTFASTTDAQRDRKQANVDWLVDRRKVLCRLRPEPGPRPALPRPVHRHALRHGVRGVGRDPQQVGHADQRAARQPRSAHPLRAPRQVLRRRQGAPGQLQHRLTAAVGVAAARLRP
jgi:hypothetical protein